MDLYRYVADAAIWTPSDSQIQFIFLIRAITETDICSEPVADREMNYVIDACQYLIIVHVFNEWNGYDIE